MISTIVSRLVILVFGTLYPAYASYKAVRTKNVKEYVKWMMYWIVFALFTCAETFTDVFLSWFPFYYEIKIILVLWLLSPATKGSSILYRKFVHPMLSRREQEIDDYIAKAKEQGYHTVLNLGTKGVNYATTVIMQTAIKGGGGIVNQLRKSYSLSDLTDDTDSRADIRALQDSEASDIVDPRHVRRRHSPRRSASGSSRVDMYFPEVDIRPGPSLSHVRSTEDVSSGYSSAEPLYVGQPPKLEPREALVRTASVGGAARPRTRTTRTSLNTKKTTPLPEDSEESESDSEVTVIQHISLKAQRPIIVPDESESSEGNDFVDTIGFPIEYSPAKIVHGIAETSLHEPIQISVIEEKIELEQTKIIQEHKIEPEQIETIQKEQKIEPEQTETIHKEPEQTETIQKEPKQTEKVQKEHKIEPEITENVEPDQTIKAVIELQIQKEPSIEIFEDTVETNETEEINNHKIVDKTNKIDNTPGENIPVESISATSSDIDSISLTSVSQRKGKYNKHTAPAPPEKQDIIPETTAEIVDLIPETENKNLEVVASEPETPEVDMKCDKPENAGLSIEKAEPEVSEPSIRTSDVDTHPIKATLVLKPGVIKNIGPPTEESPSKTQIFFSQSPKAKRKSKSKHDNPISRLMMLPKMIFGNKSSSSESLKDKEKRKSWHPDTRSLTPSSVEDLKSKSDTEDLYEPIEVHKSISAIDIASKKHEENKMILRTLSHSPKQYRRRTRKEDDYEDSD